jgi:hypothetical protein
MWPTPAEISQELSLNPDWTRVLAIALNLSLLTFKLGYPHTHHTFWGFNVRFLSCHLIFSYKLNLKMTFVSLKLYISMVKFSKLNPMFPC